MAVTIGSGITVGAGVGISSSSASIVTDGLLLNFDAATYSGTGNWIDSWTGVEAVPSNNPVWSPDNGGTFVLSAPAVQYFTVPWPTFQPTYTLDIWFNFTAAQPPGAPCLISDEFTGAPFNFAINTSGNTLVTGWYTTNWGGQQAYQGTIPTDGSTWYNITMAVDTTNYKDYINGAVSYDPGGFSSIGISSPNGSSPTHQFYIGKRWDLTDTVNAKMAVVNIYDRALTDAEVAQNFNYYKSRFGL